MTSGVELLKVGVVGLGQIGASHAQTLARLPGVEVSAVADVDPSRWNSNPALGGAKGYVDWEVLLERERLDAVFVCTPPMMHLGPAKAALENGIHVFVEKPIARGHEDAGALVSAARASGCVCAMGYQWRAIDLLDYINASLAHQRLGLLSGRSIGPSRKRDWFVNWSQGGGILLELASHVIDLQRAIGGEVESAEAAAGYVPTAEASGDGVPSVLSLTLRFASGAIGAIQVAWTTEGVLPSWALDVVTDSSTFYLALDPHFALTFLEDGREVTRHGCERPV